MNLAVRLYASIPSGEKPSGIPDAWPASVIELGESITLPDNENWQLMTCVSYNIYKQEHLSEYNTWKSSVDAPENTKKYIKSLIFKAQEFGIDLMAEYGAENILSGKTIAQIAAIASKMKDVQLLLQSGSLYTAEQVMGTVEPDPNISEDTIKTYRNKIRSYLGMSLLA